MKGEDATTKQHFSFVTIFPELIEAFVQQGLIGKALAADKLAISCVDPRSFATDKHRTVDDTPFGGGAGMLMQAEPVANAIEDTEARHGRSFRVLVTPSAKRFDQADARDLAKRPHISFLCGRYEGIDDRIREQMVDASYSLGDFVLNGGEVAALAIFEAVARLADGVLGNPESVDTESFAATPDAGQGSLLEHPQYTRPATWRGHEVPELLRQGDHEKIARWRLHAALQRTHTLRPDLSAPPDQLRKALSLPIGLAFHFGDQVSLDELASLAAHAEPRAISLMLIGGRGRAKGPIPRYRNLRESRQALKREARATQPTVLKPPKGAEAGPVQLAGPGGIEDGEASTAGSSRTLAHSSGGPVWVVLVEPWDSPNADALSARALADLLSRESAHDVAPSALLLLFTWPDLEVPARFDARLRLDRPVAASRDASPQKDRNALAIAAPLIDISQPARPQVGAIVDAVKRSLGF